MGTKRKVIRGASVSSGIAMGRAQVIPPGHLNVAEVPIPAIRVKEEISALEQAVMETAEELRQLRDSGGKKLGGSLLKIFDAQLAIAGDQEFLQRVKSQIALRKRNAGFVYNALVKETIHQLESSADEYMRQMIQEIEAVAHRVLSHLSGFGQKSTVRLPENTLLVGKSFGPGDILSYHQRRAVGFLAAEGSAHSHMALIARSLMIPMAVIPQAMTTIPGGCRLIIDGTNGLAVINPTDEEWSEYQRKKRRQGPAIITRIKRLTDIPPHTADGQALPIAANLELPGPVDEILALKNLPIGLYRTEFLYLEAEGWPDEAMQFHCYSRLATKFASTEVVFRTFDIGSDKTKGDDIRKDEPNPALGWRGIRSMLEMPDVFKAQIRALLRASTRGNIKILLPMVTEAGELKKAKRLISQVMLELRRAQDPFDENIPIGIMVEVPSAALTIRPLAELADFVAIGTNDLTQYTMAADRANSRVSNLYDPYHPSVISLIKTTVAECRRQNTPVSICGEMAGDPLALPLFVGLGVSQLSMNPSKIFDTCRLVNKINADMARPLAAAVVASTSTSSVKRKLAAFSKALKR